MSSPIVEQVTIHLLRLKRRRSLLRRPVTGEADRLGVLTVLEFRDGTRGCGEAVVPVEIPFDELVYDREELRRSHRPGGAQADPVLDALCRFHPTSFVDALEQIQQLPVIQIESRFANVARPAFEMALLDATLRFFDRGWDEVVGWMELQGFGSPGCIDRALLLRPAERLDMPLLKDQIPLLSARGGHGAGAAQPPVFLNIEEMTGILDLLESLHRLSREGIAANLRLPDLHTSILTAAVACVLRIATNVQWLLGDFGSMENDVIRRQLKADSRGHLRAVSGPGLGIAPDSHRIEALTAAPPVSIKF